MSSDKKTICLNLFAGPSSGKSTLAAAVFALLKMHGVDAELVTEFAKDLTWENRQDILNDNQYYVWGKQYHKLWRLNGKVDIIVTDSSLLLGLMYGAVDEPQCFKDSVMHSYNKFSNINYFIKRIKEFNPNGRNQTADESVELDNRILGMLKDNGIDYEIVAGDLEGANKIANDLLCRFEKVMCIKFNTMSLQEIWDGWSEEYVDILDQNDVCYGVVKKDL